MAWQQVKHQIQTLNQWFFRWTPRGGSFIFCMILELILQLLNSGDSFFFWGLLLFVVCRFLLFVVCCLLFVVCCLWQGQKMQGSRFHNSCGTHGVFFWQSKTGRSREARLGKSMGSDMETISTLGLSWAFILRSRMRGGKNIMGLVPVRRGKNMGVSKNWGTPKWMVYNGKSH